MRLQNLHQAIVSLGFFSILVTVDEIFSIQVTVSELYNFLTGSGMVDYQV